MNILAFFIGLAVGLLLLVYQRSRDRERLKTLLRTIQENETDNTPFSLASKLSLAMAYQQEQHRETQERLEMFRQLLNVAPVGYLHVDDENRLVWANPTALRWLRIANGVPSPPRLLLELVRSYDLDELIDQTRRAEAPQQASWLFYPVSPDLSAIAPQPPCALRGHGFPLANHHVGVFLESQQEAILLKQQRDRWISDVAHELKTPLTSIRLVAETLHSRLTPPLQGWAERLIDETMRLSGLVQDLLDLSQLEQRSPHQLKRTPIDLIALLNSAWQNLDPLARRKSLTLDYQGPERVSLSADETRMYRVLLNLLDNSIKYSPPEAAIRVEVRTGLVDAELDETAGDQHELESGLGDRISGFPPEASAPQRWIVMDVIDQGQGFPPEAIAHVFERFFRADPSRHRPSPSLNSPIPAPIIHSSGSGLGLSIVQQIIDAHGGSITAQNHPETGGAWLRLRLPED